MVTKEDMEQRARLLANVAEIVPLIEKHADQSEENRELVTEVHEAFVNAGIFRMFVPRSLGGLEVDYATAMHVIEAVARVDGGSAWCAFLSGVNAAIAKFTCDEGVEEIFRDPRGLTAGCFFPPGRAIKVEGGYRATGRWPYGSNTAHATWIMGHCVVYENDKPRLLPHSGEPEIRTMWFNQGDFKAHDTWYTTGMRASGSQDFSIDDLFVPDHLSAATWGEDTPKTSHFGTALFRMPHIAFTAAGVAPVQLGIARHALDLLAREARTRRPVASKTTLRERPVAQDQYARAEAEWHSCRAWMYQIMDEMWDKAVADTPITEEDKGRFLLAATHANQTSVKVVDMVKSLAGGSGIFTRNPIERCFRDIHTGAHHTGTNPSKYERAGKLLFGVEPEQWYDGARVNGEFIHKPPSEL